MQTTFEIPFIGRGRIVVSLAYLIRLTEERLRRVYGIRNLSIIERAHLRRVVERVAANIELQWIAVGYNSKYFSRIPAPYCESAWVFASEACGIDSDTLKKDIYRWGAVSWQTCLWMNITRIRSHSPCHEEAIPPFDGVKPIQL